MKKIVKLIIESRFYRWRESIVTEKPIVRLFGDIMFVITFIATILTIKDSCINWYQRNYESDKAAVEYYRIGEKYYLDKNYEESLINFKKVYEINKNMLDTKYYYTMSLLHVNEKDNSIIARKILYENSEYLNQNENAVYAMLEFDMRENDKCLEISKTIEDPLQLKDEIFVEYIRATTIASIDLNFSDGQNLFFNNILLIDRKINSLGLLGNSEIKKFDDVTINLDITAFFDDELYKLNQCIVEMAIYYLDECERENEFGKILPTMEISSSYFDIFYTEQSVSKDYLKHFYNYIDMFSEYNEKHLISLEITIRNIVSKLNNGKREVWGEDLDKCKEIYKKLITEYDTTWTKYD